MKKSILVLFVTLALCLTIIPVSAITKSDKPITGGNTIFGQAEMMYTGEPTATSAWSNAFCNEDWTGCRWVADTKDGVKCIKINHVEGKTNAYMDFNWYQWNNDKYYPSLDCSQYKFFKVVYMFNDAAAKTAGASQFWVSQDSPVLSKTLGTGTLKYNQSATKANVWITDIIDLSGLSVTKDGKTSAWKDITIRQFRYYPFGSVTGTSIAKDANVWIEYMAFFKTKAEAEAYKGPNATTAAAATTKAAATTAAKAATTASAKTADASVVIAAVIVSAAAAAIVLKNKKH